MFIGLCGTFLHANSTVKRQVSLKVTHNNVSYACRWLSLKCGKKVMHAEFCSLTTYAVVDMNAFLSPCSFYTALSESC